jgi:ElaB/YqjD/DUF883 family membrane-anchored ribosome-binding protein
MSTSHDTLATPEPTGMHEVGTPETKSPHAQAQEAERGNAHKVQATRKDVTRKAQELGEQGKELASEYYQQGRDQALIWQKQLQQHIREKPLQSLAVAGGIGLLLGLLWRR